MKKFFCITLIAVMMLSSIMTVSAEENQWVVKPQYDEIVGSDETGTIICVSKDGKYGYIDNTGKVLIDFQFEKADIFSEGVAFVEKDGVKGFIEVSGKFKFKTHNSEYFPIEGLNYYHTCERFSNGLAKIYLDNWSRTFIDKDGNMVDDYAYQSVLDREIESNIVTVDSQKGVTYYNLDTKKELEGEYFDTITFSEGYGAVVKYSSEKERQLTYILDKDFNIVAKDLEYNKFLNRFTRYNNSYVDVSIGYKNGYLVVGNGYYEKNSYIIKYGVIDTKGKEIISLTYDELGVYNDKMFAATINGKTGYIDINNKWIIKAIYNKASDFKNGIAIVSEDFNKETWKGTFGIINTNGKYLLKPQFEEIKFDENSNLVYAKENGKWGILNITNLKVDNKPTVSNDEPENWAKSEVGMAIINNLVPENLQNKYKEKITRKEFCELAINLILEKTEKTLDDILSEKGLSVSNNPFTDTSDKIVVAAYKLGIVNGKGNGLFVPNGYITRQEAAVMLSNTAKIFGVDIEANEASFVDKVNIASWAKASVNYVSSKYIMKGTDKGFEPNSNYTRQQAFITILRLSDNIVLKDKIINPENYEITGVVVDEFGNPLQGVSIIINSVKTENNEKISEYISTITTDKNGVYAFNKPDKNNEYRIFVEDTIIDDVLYTTDFRVKYSIESKKIVMYRVYSVEVTSVDVNGEELQGELNVKIISDVKYKDHGAPGQINNHFTIFAEKAVLIYYYTDAVEINNPVAYVECNGMKGELSFSFEKGDYKIKRITVVVK